MILKFKFIFTFNSLPTSVVCSKPLQTDWTQIRPDEMSGLIWIQSVDTRIEFLKEFFEKDNFEKKNQQTTKRHEKFPRGKELK